MIYTLICWLSNIWGDEGHIGQFLMQRVWKGSPEGRQFTDDMERYGYEQALGFLLRKRIAQFEAAYAAYQEGPDAYAAFLGIKQ